MAQKKIKKIGIEKANPVKAYHAKKYEELKAVENLEDLKRWLQKWI